MTDYEDSRDDQREYRILAVLKASTATLDAYITARLAAAQTEEAENVGFWAWVLQIARIRGLL